jgi:hypothetical protein
MFPLPIGDEIPGARIRANQLFLADAKRAFDASGASTTGDIDVSLVDDILTIRGEKKLDKKDEKRELPLRGALPRHVLALSAAAILR